MKKLIQPAYSSCENGDTATPQGPEIRILEHSWNLSIVQTNRYGYRTKQPPTFPTRPHIPEAERDTFSFIRPLLMKTKKHSFEPNVLA